MDLESMRTNVNIAGLVHRFFSPREYYAAPPRSKELAFWRGSTRKEAYGKATGDGLALAVDHVDVIVTPWMPARVVREKRDPGEAARWSLQDVDPHADYVGALAVEGYGWHRVWQLPPSPFPGCN